MIQNDGSNTVTNSNCITRNSRDNENNSTQVKVDGKKFRPISLQ